MVKAAMRGRMREDCEKAKAGKRRPRARRQRKGEAAISDHVQENCGGKLRKGPCTNGEGPCTKRLRRLNITKSGCAREAKR